MRQWAREIIVATAMAVIAASVTLGQQTKPVNDSTLRSAAPEESAKLWEAKLAPGTAAKLPFRVPKLWEAR